MVEVGLTLVEPLAAVDVNAPGVMEMLEDPVVDQLSVLLEPEFIPVGFAEKEAMVGGELLPGDEAVEPQATNPAQAARVMRRRGGRPV